MLELDKIYCMDCLEGIKQLSDNSVDGVVTDPPYGWSFMGKKWDYDVPKIEVWSEVLHVLKPGGHILVACGTRTQHRMAINIEDAGFEIRDLIAWVYGSGFPKSLNIGKAIDKLQENKREIIGKKKIEGGWHHEHIINDDGWKGSKQYETKGTSGYDGWGTTLKPAMELWTLARKPLEGTVAENVLKWGTGGLNIDECRINLQGIENHKTAGRGQGHGSKIYHYKDDKELNPIQIEREKSGENPRYYSNGRFPANFIHDGSDEVVELFPDSKSTGGCTIKRKGGGNVGTGKANEVWRTNDDPGFGDNGSTSRFFYCAKASKNERNQGCEELEPQQRDEGRKEGNPGGDNQRNRGVHKRTNFHPTVKPVALMRYLCNLITPPNGLILDPYIGSGTTALACRQLNRHFIGFEISPEYCEIANKRLKNIPRRLESFQ